MIIYKATNIINGKSYIGQSIQTIEQRKTNHIRCALNNASQEFPTVLRKYGIDSFKWEILCECESIDELNKKEIFYIKKYDTKNKGYNMVNGGVSNIGSSNPMYGKKRPDLVQFNKDRVKQPDYVNPMQGKNWMDYSDKETIKKSNLARSNSMLGLKRTDENRRRNSEYAKKRMWMVNKKGNIKHTTDINDSRLLSGEYIRGRVWK